MPSLSSENGSRITFFFLIKFYLIKNEKRIVDPSVLSFFFMKKKEKENARPIGSWWAWRTGLVVLSFPFSFLFHLEKERLAGLLDEAIVIDPGQQHAIWHKQSFSSFSWERTLRWEQMIVVPACVSFSCLSLMALRPTWSWSSSGEGNPLMADLVIVRISAAINGIFSGSYSFPHG